MFTYIPHIRVTKRSICDMYDLSFGFFGIRVRALTNFCNNPGRACTHLPIRSALNSGWFWIRSDLHRYLDRQRCKLKDPDPPKSYTIESATRPKL